MTFLRVIMTVGCFAPWFLWSALQGNLGTGPFNTCDMQVLLCALVALSALGLWTRFRVAEKQEQFRALDVSRLNVGKNLTGDFMLSQVLIFLCPPLAALCVWLSNSHSLNPFLVLFWSRVPYEVTTTGTSKSEDKRPFVIFALERDSCLWHEGAHVRVLRISDHIYWEVS